MDALSAKIDAACANGTIPGVVLAATNISGTLNYARAFGQRSLEGGGKPYELSTLMSLFSGTKLVTTIAALQLVESGKIGLDDDVSKVLPELGGIPVLVEIRDGKSVLEKRKTPLTLRHLLTHSSGLTYPFMVPKLAAHLQSVGKPPFSPPTTVVKSYDSPLAFEPGTSWSYGTGLDWAGLLIVRLSGTNLEAYIQEHICSPLGILDITFWPTRSAELTERLSALFVRDPNIPNGDGQAVLNRGPNMQAAVQEEFGGQGLSASMPSYLKILQSLLTDDEKLLKKTSTAQMFQPQLTVPSEEALQTVYRSKPTTGPCSIGVFPPDVHYSWGLGGLLTLEDVQDSQADYRRKNCLNWSGMPNIYWFLDRSAGVCGIFGSQIMPAGDPRIKELHSAFERAVYEAATNQAS